MPFNLIAEVVDRHQHQNELILIDTYDTIKEARKKAKDFFKNGSVPINVGGPYEQVMNTSIVKKIHIEEV